MKELLNKTIHTLTQKQFSEMTEEGKSILADNITPREVYKGEIILKEGEISTDIIFVGKGMLRRFYFKNKKDITEQFSYENGIVTSVESLLKQEPSKSMIEAIEQSTIFLLPYDRIKILIETYPEINRFYRSILEDMLIQAQAKADSWRFESAKERYSRLLKEHPAIVQRATLAQVASYLLMTPETLSRVRSQL